MSRRFFVISALLAALLRGGAAQAQTDARGFAVSDRRPLAAEGRSLLAVTNPLTGKPFTARQAQRVQLLRQKFPRNSLLPRVLGEAERARRDADLKRDAVVLHRMALQQASPDDLRWHFDRRRQELEDWIELLRFVAGEKDWSGETRARYSRMHAEAVRQLQALEARRRQALSRAP